MNPIFIVGCSRSGTTWVSRLIATSTSAAWIGEAEWGRRAAAGERPWDRVPSDLIVEKTPWNVFYIEALARALPGARFVEVVRDPRAVAASMMAAARNWARAPGTFDVRRASILWKRAIVAGAASRRVVGRNLVTVRYEDLSREPGALLTSVLCRLGMSVDRLAVQQAIVANDFARLRNSGLAGPLSFHRYGKPDSWVQELSNEEVRIVVEVTRDTAIGHGYDVG